MGHTRYATVGDKTKRNAHPFHVGNITLAHNGAIWNHKEVGEKYKRTYECDSEHLVHHMAEKLPMKDLEGYGAMEWVEDETPENIKLMRLSYSGSLAISKIMSGGEQVGTAWSSDKFHLKSALGAARLDGILYEEGKAGEVFEAANGILFNLKQQIEISTWHTNSYQTTGWEHRGGRYFRSGGVGYWNENDYVKEERGNGITVWTPKKDKMGGVSGVDSGGKKEDKTPGDAIVLQYPGGESVVKDEHQYMGLKRMPNGDWVDPKGNIIDTDKALASLTQDEEEEEAQYMREYYEANGISVDEHGHPIVEMGKKKVAENDPPIRGIESTP